MTYLWTTKFSSLLIFALILLSCSNKNTLTSDQKPLDLDSAQLQMMEALRNYNSDERLCSESEIQLLRDVGEGNFAAAWDYLKNGGDPNLSCVANTTEVNGRTYQDPPVYLFNKILRNDSIPVDFMTYYLSLDLSQNVKDELLTYYLSGLDAQDKIYSELLVQKEAHYHANCFHINGDLQRYAELHGYDYDFNWQDPARNGKTMLMEMAACPCILRDSLAELTIDPYDEEALMSLPPENTYSASEVIEIMKILIEYGARTDITDNDGKSIIELAVNEEIKAFLKSIK